MIPLIRDLLRRFFRHRLLSQSAQLAFYLLLSFFPCLIILTRFAVHETVLDTLLHILNGLLPSAAADLVQGNLSSLGSFPLLPTGIVVLFYAASRGVSTLIYASVTAYDAIETRSFVFRFLLRFLLLPLILLLGVTAIVGLLLLNSLLARSAILFPLWQILRYPISLLVASAILAVFYFFLPTKRVPLYRHLPGAIFSAVVGIAASFVFSAMADLNHHYSAYYGNMSGVILLLLWLYLCSLIVLLGIELNASIFQKGDSRHEHNRSDAND